MTAADLQQMADEQTALSAKVLKLIGFIGSSDEFEQLAQHDKQLVHDQLKYMSLYGMALGLRIQRYSR